MSNSKKDIIFYTALVTGYIAFAVLMGNLYINIAQKVSGPLNPNLKTIVIDAGHGGEDSGAVADNGILEKDINLDIAKKLRDMLRATGYKVVMTRDDDNAIYDKNCKTLRKKKVSDMKKRVEIVNSDKNNILVSIHQNKFEQKQYCGSQIFYSKNNESSLTLAQSVQKSIKNLIQPDNDRELKCANKNIYLLNQANVPAIIVECGFVSNDEELEKLMDENYKLNMAFSIYSGIIATF